MPVYRQHCPQCGAVNDEYRPLSAYDQRPECCGIPMQPVFSPPQIISDISPYRAVASDVATGQPPVIGSRNAHRAFLQRNGYVEVGTEAPVSKAFVPPPSCRPELTQAVRSLLKS